jgi:hypothetical protein
MPTPQEVLRLTESFNEHEWYDFLDAVDAVARRRASAVPDKPDDPSRDAVAWWVAGRHFAADPGLAEIWYLPTGAPPDEIRLVEVSGRYQDALPDGAVLSAIDFRLDVSGIPHRLMVADAGVGEFESIRAGRASLPAGWSLEHAVRWRRGP